MNRALIVGTGDDLQGGAWRWLAANRVDVARAAEQHRVPVEHRLVSERISKAPVQIHHHLRDAALGGLHAGLLNAEAELLAQRGLNAVAVENLAFDFGGLD